MWKVLLIVISQGLMACAINLHRSHESGYYRYEESAVTTSRDFYEEKANYEKKLAARELGIATGQTLSPKEDLAVRTRMELKRLEQLLNYSREKKQYYGYKPFMTDLERIYFLKLPSIEARERWALSRGLTARDQEFDDVTTQLIEANDVAEGMSKKAVLESWGDPEVIEVAGNPLFENERWKYMKTVSSVDGYAREVRFIYFESGRVVGWERYPANE